MLSKRRKYEDEQEVLGRTNLRILYSISHLFEVLERNLI
jgi:hypothetical protein